MGGLVGTKRKNNVELPQRNVVQRCAVTDPGACFVRSSSLNDADEDLLNETLGSRTRPIMGPPVISQRYKLHLDPPKKPEVKLTFKQKVSKFYADHPVYAWLLQNSALEGLKFGLSFLAPGAGLVCQCGCAAHRVRQAISLGAANAAIVSVASSSLKNSVHSQISRQ